MTPEQLRAINDCVADLPAHLNAEHGYTIPPGQPKQAWQLAQLAKEHAAIHAERTAQEHQR